MEVWWKKSSQERVNRNATHRHQHFPGTTCNPPTMITSMMNPRGFFALSNVSSSAWSQALR